MKRTNASEAQIEYWNDVQGLSEAEEALDTLIAFHKLLGDCTTPEIAKALYETCPPDSIDKLWPLMLATALQRLIPSTPLSFTP